MKRYFQRSKNFILHEIWTIDDRKLTRRKRFYVRLLRIIVLAVQNYEKKNLDTKASALTFYTLLSIVPVAALAFGISKGFGLDTVLKKELYKAFWNQPELLENLLGYVDSMLQQTQGGLIAGFGLAILLWSVIKVLANVEEAFNSIWQVNISRTWVRKFTDYLTIMMIGPLFILASSSATIFISTSITGFADQYIGIGFVRDLIIFALSLIPYFLSAMLFTLVYLVMPNTKVHFRSAFVAGLIAGLSFQLFQWAYVEFQVGVSRYNAIYGSFAFFPLFIIFLNYSWTIVLIGAEVSSSVQNISLQVYEKQEFCTSHKFRMALALAVMKEVTARFMEGKEPLEAEEASAILKMPVKLVKETCIVLTEAGLLNEIVSENKSEFTFQPAIDPHLITPASIIERLHKVGDVQDDYLESGMPEWSSNMIEESYTLLKKSNLNRNILEVS